MIPNSLLLEDIGSDVVDDDLSIPYGSIQAEPFQDTYDRPGVTAVQFISPEISDEDDNINAGDAIDSAIRVEVPAPVPAKAEEPITRGFGRRRRKNTSEPKKTAPDVDEWLDFFSRIVIRFMTEWYADYMFRGIDEDLITDNDAAKLALTEEERDTIGRPFAEFAYKNPYLKKHGRQIVAFSDSFESAVILGRWFTRVNRIAAKYRPEKRKPQRPNVRLHPMNGVNHDVDFGQGAENSAAQGPIPDGYPIFNPGGS